MSIKTDVLNEKGDDFIILNDREEGEVKRFQPILNATGFEINLTTMTGIAKKVSEQKFFEISPSDYMPVRVGQNPWSTSILTFQEFSIGGSFDRGIINTGGNQTRLADAETAIQSITNPVRTWAERVGWSLPEMQMASRAGNWNIVEAKERSRKKIWDLGIQAIAFIGNAALGIQGLLNQTAGVNTNTSIITKKISLMTYTEFAAFVQAIIGSYRLNANFTVMPDTFLIPELDYDGLMVPVSPQFPNTSMLEYLTNAFKKATRNDNFAILPNHYADPTGNPAASNLYVLYRRNDDGSLVMDIPVPYTTTVANTTDGFEWKNAAFGQFTGPQAIRPLEMYYYSF